MGEDMMVMMKLFICAGKVGIVHRPFYHYRQSNPESLTKIYSQEHIIQVANNVYEVEKYVNASAYADSLIEFIPFLKLNIKLPLLKQMINRIMNNGWNVFLRQTAMS